VFLVRNGHSHANSPKWSFYEMCPARQTHRHLLTCFARTRQTQICQNIYMTFCEFCEYFRNVPCLACTLRGSMKPSKLKLFFFSLSPSLFLLHIDRKQVKTFLSLSPLSTNKVSAAVDNMFIQSFKHGRFISNFQTL
jgi:hypothetical protein